MENFFTRYKNPLVLMVVLVIQVIGLATQIRRADAGGPRLIRVWTVTAVTPFERLLVATGHFFRSAWTGYVDLHSVRKQNRELEDELARMRLEQARLRAGAEESQRLRALLDFKERYVGQTVAAQIIQSSGNEQSRLFYINKGSENGIHPDMAVITPDGIVGKVKEVYSHSSQVLMINDRESGAGVMLENSRLQGVLRGKDLGDLQLPDIMADEKVEVGERVVASGGDRIYPKGFPVGTVSRVARDADGGPFLAITIKPAADLNRLEEVLVVTKSEGEVPAETETPQPRRAADVLAQRLPSVPKPDQNNQAKTAPTPPVKTNPAAVATTTPGAAGAKKPPSAPPVPQPVKTPASRPKPKMIVPRAETTPTPAQEPSPDAGPKSAEPAPPTPTPTQQPPANDSEKPPR